MLVVEAAVGAVALAGYLVGRRARRATHLHREAERLQLHQTRDRSVAQVMAIHQAATRRMVEIANENVVEGTATEIDRRRR